MAEEVADRRVGHGWITQRRLQMTAYQESGAANTDDDAEEEGEEQERQSLKPAAAGWRWGRCVSRRIHGSRN